MSLAGIPRFLGLQGRAKVGTKQSYGVTAIGKQKAMDFALEGPPFKVLAYLAENGPCTFSEITRETGYDGDKIKVILRGLINDGYVVSAD